MRGAPTSLTSHNCPGLPSQREDCCVRALSMPTPPGPPARLPLAPQLSSQCATPPPLHLVLCRYLAEGAMIRRAWRFRPQCYTLLPGVEWEPLTHPRRGAFVPWNTTLVPGRFEHLLLRMTQAPAEDRVLDLEALQGMLDAVDAIDEGAIRGSAAGANVTSSA